MRLPRIKALAILIRYERPWLAILALLSCRQDSGVQGTVLVNHTPRDSVHITLLHPAYMEDGRFALVGSRRVTDTLTGPLGRYRLRSESTATYVVQAYIPFLEDSLPCFDGRSPNRTPGHAGYFVTDSFRLSPTDTATRDFDVQCPFSTDKRRGLAAAIEAAHSPEDPPALILPRDKVITLADSGDFDFRMYDLIPEGLRAARPEEATVVLLKKCRRVNSGNYYSLSSGLFLGTAVTELCTLKGVRLENSTVILEATFRGDPPDTITTSQGATVLGWVEWTRFSKAIGAHLPLDISPGNQDRRRRP
jgi:hypothetical protein